MTSGPTVAPVSSSAELTAYTHPLPCCPVEYDSIASTVGLRIARPMRSASTNAPATCQLPFSAINGEQVDGVANKRHRPVLAGLISDVSGERTQAVAEELADT